MHRVVSYLYFFMAAEERKKDKIVLEALLGENIPNYFLRHTILSYSWADVVQNLN